MYKTCFRVSLFVIILMLPLTAIYAAGLGKLTLNSALGQPLNAEIDIVTASSDEVSSLKASIASREAFTQAGVNYEPNFSTFKISIESRTNGTPYIKLTSPQAVNDPFLNVLIELNWASGRMLREYAVLLDPVEVNAQNIAAPIVSSTPVVAAAQKNPDQATNGNKNQKVNTKSLNRSANSISRDTYGPVARGDTLSSIARQVSPAGVDLNQMLVALYRANRDAFIANNMNLLRVGAVLKIPEKSDVASIETSVARSEIRMQVEDWHNYKSRVAAIAGESATANIRQSDQGKITTTIDKKSTSSRGAPKEVLRLSSGAQLAGKDGQGSESALADRLRMMEEDAIARNLALKEANERVVMLEKSIENLKHLLELKDSVLAQAQIKAAGVAPNAEIKSDVKAAETVQAASENNPPLNAESLPTQEQNLPVAQPPAQVTPASMAQAQPIPLEETEGQSLTDQIFANIEYIGAASILTLLVILLILKKRRNRLNEEAELDEDNSNFSSEMQSRMASMAVTQAASASQANHAFSDQEIDDPKYENMDSYSEKDGYDEESDNTRNSTLAMASAAYHQRGHADDQHEKSESDTSIYEFSDQTDSPPLSSSAIPVNSEEDFIGDQAPIIDSEANKAHADFTNEIDFDLTDDADGLNKDLADKSSLAADSDLKDEIELSDSPADHLESINASDYETDLDLDDSRHSHDSEETEEIVAKQENSLEYEPVLSDIDLADDAHTNVELSEIDSDSKFASKNSHESDQMTTMDDFDQQQESEGATQSKSISTLPELGLADISLDIEDSGSPDSKDETADLSDKGEQWQEVETKLDLAKAYQEMDDKEGAKEMLEEVIRDGDAKQKKAARKLLKSL